MDATIFTEQSDLYSLSLIRFFCHGLEHVNKLSKCAKLFFEINRLHTSIKFLKKEFS